MRNPASAGFFFFTGGTRAQTINVGALAVDVVEACATWLEAEGFSGTLRRFVNNETLVVLPRAAAPAP